jgi:hypothetical protein
MLTAMDIRYLRNSELDRKKWDDCVTGSSNGLIYAYSFYLDALADDWDALVLNDYEAVMPLVRRKKYGISYLYQPVFVAQLGLFGKNIDGDLLSKFLNFIPKKFRLWEFSLNHGNVFPLKEFDLQLRNNYVLDLSNDYALLQRSYRENIRRNVKKSLSYGCTFQQVTVRQVMALAKEFAPDKSVDEKQLQRFEKLYHILEGKGMAKAYGVAGKDGQLLSSCVFFFSHGRAYYILVGNHPNGRTLGASHLLIDGFIKEHAEQQLLLDFEGSDLRNLAFFYSSFGAAEEKYSSIKLNRLPLLVKWLKG